MVNRVEWLGQEGQQECDPSTRFEFEGAACRLGGEAGKKQPRWLCWTHHATNRHPQYNQQHFLDIFGQWDKLYEGLCVGTK